jgi:hypothetical protein
LDGAKEPAIASRLSRKSIFSTVKTHFLRPSESKLRLFTKRFAFVNVITGWTALTAAAATPTARHVFATVIFVSIATLRLTNALEETRADVSAMKVTAATNARGVAGVNAIIA